MYTYVGREPMSKANNDDRRHFLGTAAMTIAAAGAGTQLGMIGSARRTGQHNTAGGCAHDQAGDEHVVRRH